uniref:Uncharacterized protein n=1 Tax=Onchocerca volvulus TaxID=6282 RepID=A0A8R1TS04_ONCVO
MNSCKIALFTCLLLAAVAITAVAAARAACLLLTCQEYGKNLSIIVIVVSINIVGLKNNGKLLLISFSNTYYLFRAEKKNLGNADIIIVLFRTPMFPVILSEYEKNEIRLIIDHFIKDGGEAVTNKVCYSIYRLIAIIVLIRLDVLEKHRSRWYKIIGSIN